MVFIGSWHSNCGLLGEVKKLFGRAFGMDDGITLGDVDRFAFEQRMEEEDTDKGPSAASNGCLLGDNAIFEVLVHCVVRVGSSGDVARVDLADNDG